MPQNYIRGVTWSVTNVTVKNKNLIDNLCHSEVLHFITDITCCTHPGRRQKKLVGCTTNLWHVCHFFSPKTFDFRLIYLNSSLSYNILHQNWNLLVDLLSNQNAKFRLSVSQFGCKVNKKQSLNGRNLQAVSFERKLLRQHLTLPSNDDLKQINDRDDCAYHIW